MCRLDRPGSFIPVTREEAAASGLSRFWTGRPCKYGHLAERYVSNRQCVACNVERSWARERGRCAQDPSYRMYRSVQRRAGQVLRGRASAAQSLGCGHGKLRRFMEGRFTVGMSWDRYGHWEVDHIVPLSAAGSLEELIRLCHYRNLQPLWKRDNLMKGGA